MLRSKKVGAFALMLPSAISQYHEERSRLGIGSQAGSACLLNIQSWVHHFTLYNLSFLIQKEVLHPFTLRSFTENCQVSDAVPAAGETVMDQTKALSLWCLHCSGEQVKSNTDVSNHMPGRDKA